MRLKSALLTAAFCISAFVPLGAQAGRGCVNHEVTTTELQSALQVVGEAQHILHQETAPFALIARVGSDITEHDLQFTHAGFARRSGEDGSWVVVHQLTSCGSSGSGLFVQGLAAFMLDDLHTHDVLIVSFPTTLAKHIETVFQDGAPRRLYGPQYSIISNPGLPAKYQNSNQWVLEIIALAQARADGEILHSRDDVHRYYLRRGFSGSIIRISPLRRAMAKISTENIRFDDHPAISQRRGRYEVVSVRSVVDYLKHTDNAVDIFKVSGSYRRTEHPIDASREESESD